MLRQMLGPLGVVVVYNVLASFHYGGRHTNSAVQFVLLATELAVLFGWPFVPDR